MGIPKFFRFISERYPCLSEVVREQHIPDFDNLYLDMNGIIHNCSHPDDTNIYFNITEEQMFKDIFNYINKLFFLIKPRKLFFMAVDGVAPRAKMNQQRARRFRSAKDAEIMAKEALSNGAVHERERFDSNCITPGTEFMARLHEALRYFIKRKISTDPLWQKCRIILSGHDSPGEGEHKIMNYIRYLKSQKDYNPNTQHCLYGLDADLIVLGLCTHELRFVILREEIKFGSKAKRSSVEETRFFLLHLGLMREYLELEFHELKQYPEFNVANLVDDWILMGFLVGNDFIPHLPCLHINTNALPLLYKTYIKVYPTIRGNINESGILNLERLEIYFAALSEVEYDDFQEKYADLTYFAAKKSNENGIDEAFNFDVSEINKPDNKDLANLIESSQEFLDDDGNLSDEDQHIMDEFQNYKRNYYMDKLNKDNMDTKEKREQAICYITALQWNLHYYYRGVQSWDWYYPHHYAPFISDLKNFKDHQITFNLGKPFLPFQQLLAVLPAASKNLLPMAYRDLMTDTSSELIHYYPENFQTDLNGKQHEWEAVVLIPFIDEVILLQAMEACNEKLTPEERKRNSHGPMYEYKYITESQGELPGIYSFKTLHHVFCTEEPFWSKDIEISAEHTVCYDFPNVERTKYFRGYPTMKYLEFDFELKHARVKVFNYCSHCENMILKPLNRENYENISFVAEKFLQEKVFIGWPYLIKAKVVGVSNHDLYIDVNGVQLMDANQFTINVKSINAHLNSRMGIELEDLSVMIHVLTLSGRNVTYNNQGGILVTDQWSESTTIYPAQAVVSNIVEQDTCDNEKKYTSVEDLYSKNSVVFFLGRRYYGCKGIVLDPSLVHKVGRIKVNISVFAEPDLSEAKLLQNEFDEEYMNVDEAAAEVGIQPRCLARLTGSVLIVLGVKQSQTLRNVKKFNIGLQFKYPKQQEELSGYSKFVDSKEWRFSRKALTLVHEYCSRFITVVERLSVLPERSVLFEEDIFPDAVGEGKIQEIIKWLKEQEHIQAERLPWGSSILEKETIEKVLQAVEILKCSPMKVVKLQINPNLLLKPDVTPPELYKSKRQICLFDRVIIVRTTYMVPIGAKGTVVGVYPVKDANTVRLECVKAVDMFFEILFDNHIPNGNDIHGIAEQRVCKVPESSVLLVYSDTKLNKSEIISNTYQLQPSNTNKSNNIMQTKLSRMTGGSCQDVNKKLISNDDFWRPAPNAIKIKVNKSRNDLPNLQVLQNTEEVNALSTTPNVNTNTSSLKSSSNRSKNDVHISTQNSALNKNANEYRTSVSLSNPNKQSKNEGNNFKYKRSSASNKVIDFKSKNNCTVDIQTIDASNKAFREETHSSDFLKSSLGVVTTNNVSNNTTKSDYNEVEISPVSIPSFPKPSKQELPQPPFYWRKNARSKLEQLHHSNFNQQVTSNSSLPVTSVKHHSNQMTVSHAVNPYYNAYNVPPLGYIMPGVYNEGILHQSVAQYPPNIGHCYFEPTMHYQEQHLSTSCGYVMPSTSNTSIIQNYYTNINDTLNTDVINNYGWIQRNVYFQQNSEHQQLEQKSNNKLLPKAVENRINADRSHVQANSDNAVNDNLTKNHNDLSIQTPSTANELMKSVKPKKPPRKPRIAAKFDLLENLN